jgi:hypothetical protein
MLGMGKGIGNLRTELILSYLGRCGLSNYSTEGVLNFSDYMYNADSMFRPVTSNKEMLSGFHNLSFDKLKPLRDLSYDAFLVNFRGELNA